MAVSCFPPKKDRTERPNTETVPSTWEKVVTFGIWLSYGNGCNMVSAV